MRHHTQTPGTKARAANAVDPRMAATAACVTALRALAVRFDLRANKSATLAETDRWERDARQLRFVAILTSAGDTSYYLPMGEAWVAAGNRLIDRGQWAPSTLDEEAEIIGMDMVHASRSSRRVTFAPVPGEDIPGVPMHEPVLRIAPVGSSIMDDITIDDPRGGWACDECGMFSTVLQDIIDHVKLGS